MSLYFFFINAKQPEPSATELNTLISQNRVLSVSKEWLQDGGQSGWAICIETINGQGPLPNNLKQNASYKKKDGPTVDYKEVLSEADFLLFAQLREWRKEKSQEEGIPTYAVFNNEQLAAIVVNQVKTQEDLLKIEGVGAARANKYGASLFEFLTNIAKIKSANVATTL